MIPVKAIQVEKVSLSDMQNPRTVKPLTDDNKYFLLNRDNLQQLFQMQLSQKRQSHHSMISAKAIQVEKVSLSDMQNPRTVKPLTDISQVFSS